MDLKDFKYLITIAEEGSISKAADRLYMAQSSLSQFLTQVESDLGCKLFLRTSKGIHPTANGEIFLKHLQDMMVEYQLAKNELWDNECLKGGRVTMGISSFRGHRMLPKILKTFQERYPDVRVDVVEDFSMNLEDLLLAGKLDVGIIALPAAKLRKDVSLLTKDEVYLVIPKYHPAMKNAHYKENGRGLWIELEDVAPYNFILNRHDAILGKVSRDLFQKHKLRINALHDNLTAEMAISLASEGLGITFTYASCTAPSDRFELLSIGESGVFVDLGIATPSREYHSKAANALEQTIREVFAAE